MVSEQARWVLVNTKVDPLKVAKVWGITEEECWDYINDYNRALEAAEKARNALETQKELREWISTIPERKAVRLAVLKEKLLLAKQDPSKYDIERILWEVKSFTSNDEGITPEHIERAKQYPIQQLLNVTPKGNVSCPFHRDRTPSFQIKKNNKFTCHSCGEYGDVIDLYQKLHSVTFLEAVKALGG